ATSSHPTDGRTKQVAEGGKHHDVDPEHQPPQQRQLALELLPLGRGLRAVELAQAGLHEHDHRGIVDHANDGADDGADKTRWRKPHVPPRLNWGPARKSATPLRRSPPWRATAAETPSSPAASAGRSGSAARMPSPSRTGRR